MPASSSACGELRVARGEAVPATRLLPPAARTARRNHLSASPFPHFRPRDPHARVFPCADRSRSPSGRENPFFEDEQLWVEVAHKGEQLTARSSGVKWRPEKSFTVRKRDTPTPPAAPARYRTSFFLLFEPTASAKAGRGLWDSHEKLSIVRVVRDEVVPRAVEIFKRDPDNDGQDEVDEEEEDAPADDDIGDDTSDEDADDDDDEVTCPAGLQCLPLLLLRAGSLLEACGRDDVASERMKRRPLGCLSRRRERCCLLGASGVASWVLGVLPPGCLEEMTWRAVNRLLALVIHAARVTLARDGRRRAGRLMGGGEQAGWRVRVPL